MERSAFMLSQRILFFQAALLEAERPESLSVFLVAVITLVPLKKARSNVGALVVSGFTRPWVYPPRDYQSVHGGSEVLRFWDQISGYRRRQFSPPPPNLANPELQVFVKFRKISESIPRRFLTHCKKCE